MSLDITSVTNNNYAAIQIQRWNKLIKKHEKCREVVKKYKVKRITDIDKILHRVNVENSIHYLTVGKRGKVNDNLESESSKVLPNPFIISGIEDRTVDFPEGENIDEYMDEAVTYSTDIRDRIFVGKNIENEPLKGITDVDKNYFTIVQSSRRKLKLNMQNYIHYLKYSSRLRLQSGYVNDEILKLNEQLQIENHKICEIRATLKGYVTSFNEFLDEDHKESMKPLLLYVEEMAETEKKRLILRKKNRDVVKLRFDIYELEEAWRKSKLCEEFILIFFSILSGNKRTYYLDLKYGDPEDNKSEKMGYSESMTSLLEFQSPKVVNNDAFDLKLYNPSYLLEVFRSLEHQCLDYLTFTELREKPNNIISYHLNTINEVYGYEINNIKQSLVTLNTLIAHIEGNTETLKTYVNEIIYGLFKETFPGAEESIIINEYIKQTYTRCVTNNEASISSHNMMHELGDEYKRILLEMDSLPTGFIKEFLKDVKARRNARLLLARNTRRRLRELESITAQMCRLFTPIITRKGRKLMYRSDPPTKKELPPPKPKEITESEKEYLYLFTDFCEYTDDVKDYLSLLDNND